MRFSAAPAGRLGDRTIPWAIFGERPDVPDGLEDSALAGASLAQVASAPGAPMFEPASLFGAHMAAQEPGFAREGPVVVFVHGHQHEPRRPVLARSRSDNAHRCLYHFTETPGGPGSAEERRLHTTPWFARAMVEGGIGGPEDCRGVAIGYAYASRGGAADPFLPGRLAGALAATCGRHRQPAAPFVNAYADAEQAGYGLAGVLTQLRARLDDEGLADRRIDLFCHGLGARVVMSALALVAQGWPNDRTLPRIDRVVMLNGACYWGEAAFTLANIIFADAGRAPSFYNITSASDPVLRYLAARATVAAARDQSAEDLSLAGPDAGLLAGGHLIGRHGIPPHRLYAGFGPAYTGWIDLSLDDPQVIRWGRSHGFDLGERRGLARGGHWSCFTRPENWALYRAILHRQAGFSVRDLAAARVPGGHAGPAPHQPA